MAGRRLRLLEDSFTSGYTTVRPFRPESRAEHIHRGRSGIDRRRYHSLCLDRAFLETLKKPESQNQVDGISELRRQTLATQTKAASGNQERRRDERGRGVEFSESTTERNFMQDRPERRTSTNRSVQVNFDDEQGDRSRHSGTIWRQQDEPFSDESSRHKGPQRESSYYNQGFRSNETPPFNSFRENMTQTRQQSAYENNRQEGDFRDSEREQKSTRSVPHNFRTEGEMWQPVKVLYAEKAPSWSNHSRTVPRANEYPTSAYGYESRGATGRYPQSNYSEDWDRRQRDDGYENREYPAAYETNWNGNANGADRQTQGSQWTPPYNPREGTYRQSTEIFQSRDSPRSSNWRVGDRMVNKPPQLNDYIDGNSWSRADKRGPESREFRHPTRMESTSYSRNGTLHTSGMEGLNPGSISRGNDSFVTYRNESTRSPTMLHNARLDEPSFGARSRGRQVPIAHDDGLRQSSLPNFSRSSGPDLNGERYGGLREDFMSRGSTTAVDDEKEFLGKMMKELENQRQNLKPEVDKLIRSSSVVIDDSDLDSNMNSVTLEAGRNSYIDTSLPTPVFKAYVDIKEFSPKSVKINFDQKTNKVVVEAGQVDAHGTVGKTFTQKIALPRYADDLRLTARMNSRGLLRIEVPLLFYFPENQEDSKAKAFLYEARRNSSDGSQELEIIVRPGRDYTVQDIYPEVINDTLVIWGGKGKEKKAISKYVLPHTANIKNIKHRIGKDGCLTVVIPIT